MVAFFTEGIMVGKETIFGVGVRIKVLAEVGEERGLIGGVIKEMGEIKG